MAVSRRAVDVADLVERARKGEPRSVARLISLVENDSGSLPPEPGRSVPVLRQVAAALAPHGGRAPVVIGGLGCLAAAGLGELARRRYAQAETITE